MANTDLSNIWGNTSTSAPATTSTPATDLSGIWGKKGDVSLSVSPEKTPAASSSTPSGADLSSIWDGGESRPKNGPEESPAPAKHLYQDASQPLYKQVGDWLNTPLTESIFGLPEERAGAGGIERGLEHIASGLTSPLSVGLTLATFGTGGLVDSAGMTALKESGQFAADELPQIVKAAQTAVNTFKEAPEGATAIADAVKAAGVDPALWNRAQSFLYDNGMTEHDLISGNLIEHGAFQVLRKVVPDLPVAATVRAAKTANTLLNTGFTLQQLEAASAMSPRFLDALKEGDYDKAEEYGTEVFASGALGILGTTHALHAAGELFKPLIENDSFRPNDEWLAIDRANKEREAQHAVAEQEAINIDRSAREILGHADPGFLEQVFGGSKEAKAQKDLELATVFHQIVTGGDRTKAAEWYNALSEALGRDERLPVSGKSGGSGPINGQPALEPNGDVQKLAENYASRAGIDKDPHQGLMSVDPEQAKQVADAYQKLEHNPNDPETKDAYDALIRETKSQWDAAKAAGYKLEPWDGPGQPYANSTEMAKDVRDNKHLFYFQGGDIPESHPLGGIDPETGETYNNIFRAVHDLFGHAKNGYEFGPRGEENAFLTHSRMYSDKAVPALLTETKGQNSWVNFGEHLRDEKGNVPKKGMAGYVSPAERPYADQKAGILPPGIVNRYLKNEPVIGKEIEPPARQGTKLVTSNEAGQVRVGEDGRPLVWLNPEAFETFNEHIYPGNKIKGVSLSANDAALVAKKLDIPSKYNGTIQKITDLFKEAQGQSKQKLLTPIKVGADVQVAAEELGHTWQRELAHLGEIENHLAPSQWQKLAAIIPEKWNEELNKQGYEDHPVVKVAETAMQFMSGKAKEEIPDTDIARFLDAYYKEVVAKHGPDALESLHKINDIAAKHVGDIDAQRAKSNAASENRVANERANREALQRLEAGRQARPAQDHSGEPQGLTSREEDQEFNKLSGLRLRGSMGSPGSAALITGDNDVLVGRYHDELARQAGYKGEGDEVYTPMFRDGGVRIRSAGGAIHIDFMEPNSDTWDRVYRSIESMPDANKYYVDFRPLKGSRATGFNINAYDKDDLLFRLKDLENGRERPVAPGSVAAFRAGLFSREGEFRDKEPRFPGLPANGSRTWEEIKPFLNEEISKHDTPEKQESLTAAFNSLPDHQDYVEAIRAGRAGQMWYERSSRAFDALMDAGIDSLTKKDKPKFLNFVAALSPVQPVRSNLLMALNLWGKWDKAGRPMDVEWKDGVPKKNASLYRILKGRGNTQGVDLPARMNNAIRALQGEPLSGPKVSAFTTNLGKDGDRVTNDTWMAVFGGHDPSRINKPAVYDAMSAKIREAADATGIAPRQAQAAVWSFIKSLAELSGWGNDRWIPPQEIIRQRLLTPELVGMHSADFADLIQNDPEIRDAIKAIGGDLNVLDRKIKTYVPGKPTTGQAAEPNPQLLGAAERLEGARRDARVANHLSRKQEPSLFDTQFSPNNGLFSRDTITNHALGVEEPKEIPLEMKDGTPFLLKRTFPAKYDAFLEDGTKVGTIGYLRYPDGEFKVSGVDVEPAFRRKGIATAAYDALEKVVGKPFSDTGSQSDMGRAFWEARHNRTLFSRESPNNGQLAHQIETNVFKNQPKDYQDLVMESLRRNAVGELSDREISAAKKLRDEQDRNYEIGSSNDLLHHYIEDYMTRTYKDTNPDGRLILSDAKGGRFATNVSMAKQRVYDSNLTALLKSPKQMLLDPVDVTARGRASLIKAAANRALIDNLRDKFTRASDGRPAVVLSGSGQVIAGQNGEDPSIFVDPNRVRKINIDPKVLKQLSDSGDLDRYLENGTVRDITPYVRPNNIGAAIDRLEEQVGRSTPIPDEHGQNPLRTKIMLLKSMQANNDFSGLKDFNEALEKKYAWDPQDYISLANNSMKGWNFITNSPDGTPVYVRSDIKVHPEFADYLKNRLGLAPSEISKNPVGKALLGAGTRLKHTLLSLSPFHMVQEALRGIMVGVNPFHITGPDILSGEKIDPADPNSPTIIRKAVENGFTTGTDYKSLQSHSEGVASGGGILDKIPGVGKVIANSLNWYQDFLFKRYIPALKARGVELMFNEYRRLHPEWSVDRIAKAAATHTNDTFGGINWQAMGRSATTQDWGRLMLLAPDWLESEMRSGARLFNKDEGGLGRTQVAKMALGLWGIARVLNLVTTGNAHLEAPFGLAVKNKEGKETVFSIRTLPTDLLHAASDPVGFIKGRLSPTVRTGTELISGRDQYGRKLQPQDLWVDVFRNMSPLPLQAVGQAVSGAGPEVGNVGQAVKALGGTAQTYRTPAQKMAADLASSHSEDGPVDPSQMARHRRVIQLEDQARAGEVSWPDLYKLTYATDQLRPEELKKIETVVKETKGMDPGTAALYSRASRLPAKEYLSLLDVMNNAERAALAPLTLKVQKRYLNKARKELTPSERDRDPVFQRLLHMTPGVKPGPVSMVSPPSIPAPIQKEVTHLYSATHQDTGHKISSPDGVNWVDAVTGEPVSA